MTRMRGMTIVMLLAAVFVAVSAADAQGRRGGRGPAGRMGDIGLPLRALNLTDAQREQIRAIREGHEAELTAIRERLRPARAAQREAMRAVPLNESAVRVATLTLAEVEADLAVAQGRIYAETWAVLTPEQQAQVKKQQETRAERTLRTRRGPRAAQP